MRQDHSTTGSTTVQRRTWTDYDLEGWERGVPPGIWPEAVRIDREVAERYPCEVCGGPMRYIPYRQPRRMEWRYLNTPQACGWGYRAFAECQRCGHVEEF